jgi:uncharacterized membrane protein YsdA (DUF1294 family)/cold shock CspA family protein
MDIRARPTVPGVAQHGVVVKFDAARGYGFIRPADAGGDGRDVFVHIRNVIGSKALRPGQSVTYRVAQSHKGLTALDVQPGSILSTPYLRFILIGMGCALLLLTGLSLTVHQGSSLALWLALWTISFSMVTFGIYRYDKRQAESSGTRVPELALHLLCALGGSPGAFIGMRWPSHHKTAKPAFQVVFWMIVALQIGALLFWLLNR